MIAKICINTLFYMAKGTVAAEPYLLYNTIIIFIYLFSFALAKNVHNTGTTIHIHETQQEVGTPCTTVYTNYCGPFNVTA
jgi:hypothetical protein